MFTREKMPKCPGTIDARPVQQLATLNDITDSMRQQLLIMVEWAKTLPPFTQMQIFDQVAFD